MSPRPARAGSLLEQIDALTRSADALAEVAPAAAVEEARHVLERTDRRRALSAEHTVVGFFGATGSGKSSLVNAVVGEEVTRAAVRRPTTSQPVAAVLGDAGSEELLDWLGVSARRHLAADGPLAAALAALEQQSRAGRRARRRADDATAAPESTSGLIMLDLPDLDSVEAANRAIAERMTGLVDVLVWVTDPQKYADAVLHQEFVRRFAGHDAVTMLVLNQIDRIRPTEREGVVASLTALSRRDGLASAPVLAASAQTGEGIDDLRGYLGEIARSREAIAARQRADVAGAAATLRESADPTGMSDRVRSADVDTLVADLGVAARVEPVAKAVGASYRFRAAGRVGWPPLRWVRRFRPDPLARWNIGQERDGEDLARTSLPEPDAAVRARASGGVRTFADAASAGGSDPWRSAVRRAARARQEELPDALDRAVAGADLRARRRAWWWPVMDVLQWLAMLTGVVGLGWLALNAALNAAAIPPPPMPMIEDLWIPIPLPVALIVLGLAAGLLLTVAGSAIAAVAGAWMRRRARRLLLERVRSVGQEFVVDPVQVTLSGAADAARDLALAEGKRAKSGV